MQFRGPHYETPAEVQMAKAIGGHIVGMSTALEAIAARQAGMEILGMSLITNLAAGIQKTPLSHAEVLEAGRMPRRSSARCSRRSWRSCEPSSLDDGAAPGSRRTPTTRPAPSSRRSSRAGDDAGPRRRDSSARLEFGTAGSAASSAPGPNRMNRVLVGQAAAGLRRLPARARAAASRS